MILDVSGRSSVPYSPSPCHRTRRTRSPNGFGRQHLSGGSLGDAGHPAAPQARPSSRSSRRRRRPGPRRTSPVFRRQGRTGNERGERGQGRAGLHRRNGDTAAPPAPDPDKQDAPAATPQTRIVVFGDSDFASNGVGLARQRRPVPEHDQLAHGSGEPHLHPPDANLATPGWRSNRSRSRWSGGSRCWCAARRARRRRVQVGEAEEVVRHARRDIHRPPRRRAHWSCRLHLFVDAKKPVGDAEPKEKAFAGVPADDIEEMEIKSTDGERSRLRKTDGLWKLVEPLAAEPDAGEVSSITGASPTQHRARRRREPVRSRNATASNRRASRLASGPKEKRISLACWLVTRRPPERDCTRTPDENACSC